MSEELFLPLRGRGQVLIEAPPEPAAVLVGFHGYAQRPEQMLEHLRGVPVEGLSLWSVRGPHHFYDRRGEVVASWMTRFDRDEQVSRQVEYLRAVLDAAAGRHPERPRFLLGFSQGVATAWRAATLTGREVSHLFGLAGDMPPEVASALDRAPRVPATLLRGTDDAVVDGATLERDRDRLLAARWEVELHEMQGGHEVLPPMLELVGRRIWARLDPRWGETNRPS